MQNSAIVTPSPGGNLASFIAASVNLFVVFIVTFNSQLALLSEALLTLSDHLGKLWSPRPGACPRVLTAQGSAFPLLVDFSIIDFCCVVLG